jgi:hypothetical protein
MTIKTQVVDDETRIITKVIDGKTRISCECCAGGCCMYPANQLGAGYTEADLPDAVTINWSGYSSGSATRSGSTYTVGGTTLSVSGGIWVLTNGSATQNVGACLLRGDGGLTSGNDLVEDQFPDELNRESSSAPAVRSRLCYWCLENVSDGFSVVYWDGQGFVDGEESPFAQRTDCNDILYSLSLTPHKWYLFPVQDFILQKIGNQNTPIGTYEYIAFPGSYKEIT